MENRLSLKQKLSCVSILTHPSTDREFILTTDASTVGIGAELAQETNAMNHEVKTLEYSKDLRRLMA